MLCQAVKSGSIATDTAEGRQALRDLYKKHGVHAAHKLTGDSWKKTVQIDDLAKGRVYNRVTYDYDYPKITLERTYRKCSECNGDVIIDQKKVDDPSRSDDGSGGSFF